MIIGALICGIASWNVKRTFQNCSGMLSRQGLTAEQAAMMILHNAGIDDVPIERVSGNLTDHYAPKEKVLRLSDSVYGSSSIAAIGVAAHECGHAIQDREGYAPLKLRSASGPVARFGSMLSWPVILIGLLLGLTGLAQVGVFLFSFVVLFQLVTLPVELNASRRALAILGDSNMLSGEELDGASKVLKAAALTYVAALFSSILQLLRLILLTHWNSSRRRR